jgi:N-carbamoylputrescine amidase
VSKKKMAWLQGRWLGDAGKTLDWYARTIATEVTPGTIVVLPELCHTPYFPVEESDAAFDSALPAGHVFLERFSALAAQTQSVIVFPFFERRHIGVYHNTVAVFDTDGTLSGIYRKSHIPDDPGFYEKYYFHPGDTGMRPIRTRLGSLGVLICWDQWFPEAARLMALAGAEVLIYPTAIAWDLTEPAHLYDEQLSSWKLAIQGHAVSNGIFAIAVNRVGEEGRLKFWGHSFAAGPTGRILRHCDDAEMGLVSLAIDTDEMERQRRMWPFFRDRRIDQYKDLLKRWID